MSVELQSCNPMLNVAEQSLKNVQEECIASSQSMTATSLWDMLQQDWAVATLLRCCGIVFPLPTDPLWYRILQTCWSIIVRIFVVYIFAFGVFFFADNMSTEEYKLIEAFTGLALASQAVVFIPSFPGISTRLNSPAAQGDIQHYKLALQFSLPVFLFSIIVGNSVSFNTYCFEGSSDPTACSGAWLPVLAVLQGIGQLSLSCLLAANCMFVLVDCFASIGLIDELLLAHKSKALTVAQFNTCRSNIQHRVDSNYWTYNAILFVALLDLLLITILFYLDSSDINAGVLVVYSLVFVKEMPFILLALYYAMIVNGRADILTQRLGKHVYSAYHRFLLTMPMYI